MEEESVSYPGFAPPDLCSIRTSGEQYEVAETVRSGFNAASFTLGDDCPPVPLTSGIDRAIRLSAAVAVLAVAGIAAYVCYWHAYAVVRATARPGSPPGSSRPRSTAWSTPVRCSPGVGKVSCDVALTRLVAGRAAFLRDCGACCW